MLGHLLVFPSASFCCLMVDSSLYCNLEISNTVFMTSLVVSASGGEMATAPVVEMTVSAKH